MKWMHPYIYGRVHFRVHILVGPSGPQKVAPKYMGESQSDMGAPINPPGNERKSK